jgi:hypothetical protein
MPAIKLLLVNGFSDTQSGLWDHGSKKLLDAEQEGGALPGWLPYNTCKLIRQAGRRDRHQFIFSLYKPTKAFSACICTLGAQPASHEGVCVRGMDE